MFLGATYNKNDIVIFDNRLHTIIGVYPNVYAVGYGMTTNYAVKEVVGLGPGGFQRTFYEIPEALIKLSSVSTQPVSSIIPSPIIPSSTITTTPIPVLPSSLPPVIVEIPYSESIPVVEEEVGAKEILGMPWYIPITIGAIALIFLLRK